MEKNALYLLTQGLYLVTSAHSNKRSGAIVSMASTVAPDLKLVSVSLHKDSFTLDLIKQSNKMALTVLSENTPRAFVSKFGFWSGSSRDKLEGVALKVESDVPIVTENAVAYVVVDVTEMIDLGSHVLIVGKVSSEEVLTDEEPMTTELYKGFILGVIGHPTLNYIYDEKLEKYRCQMCDYIYDPAKGDPDFDIAPHTAFEDLPEEWMCAGCGSPKGLFSD
jgi:rubredoxin/flavin reductase (DIM6/NTAB) family NADH-FMN oxidoreductase RutF